MNNYHYIIAGLPELMPDFHAEGFSYKDLELAIREQLSAHDRRLVDWLDFGTDTTHLSGHFYRAVSRQKSGFLKCYFDMDRKMRNAQVEFLSEKEGRDSGKYTVGETESYKDEFPELQAIFQCGDLFEREHRLDMFRWERITGMTLFHYFDMSGQRPDSRQMEQTRQGAWHTTVPPVRRRGQRHIQRCGFPLRQ